jgi:hypothetical protein
MNVRTDLGEQPTRRCCARDQPILVIAPAPAASEVAASDFAGLRAEPQGLHIDFASLEDQQEGEKIT